MAASPRSYLWQKYVSRDWLTRNESVLSRQAAKGYAIVERPGKRLRLVEIFCEDRRAARRLVETYGGKARPLLRDWQKRLFEAPARKPLRIGSRLTIIGNGKTQPLDRNQPTLIIPAAAAFGTGEHATTAMCLRFVERFSRDRPRGWSLLDLGTGSGILALAARKLGAGSVVGIDHDRLAISTARENAKANRIRGAQWELDDVLAPPGREKFDVITANLFSELLIAALPQMKRRLKSSGHAILSGILRAQEHDVRHALQREDFQ
ncbi:MAG TPA: 50S ribosomal protein L11 methyltransferase, partial [Chthoniobacterales bacterium]|nr:50S ribosomal protein L11 methyltransferase [Chthoniobacterales bacterium]